MEQNKRMFDVLFTKSCTKKRKIYQDGILSVLKGGGSYRVVLLQDIEGKEIIRKQVADNQCHKYISNSEIVLGGFEIQIEKESGITGDNTVTTAIDVKETCTSTIPQLKRSKITSNNHIFPHLTTSSTISVNPHLLLDKENANTVSSDVDIGLKMDVNISTTKYSVSHLAKRPFQKIVYGSQSNVSNEIKLSSSTAFTVTDSSLLRSMRPHQISGANFLLNRINKNYVERYSCLDDYDDGRSNSVLGTPDDCSGVILAGITKLCYKYIEI
jgi:hypothetical protein